MPLANRDKAALYDDLMRDIEEFVKSMEDQYQKTEDIKQQEEELKANDPDHWRSHLLGIYQGNNFGLRIKIDYFLGKLKWFKEYERKYGYKK